MGGTPRRPHGPARLVALGTAVAAAAALLSGWGPGAPAEDVPQLKQGKTLTVKTAPIDIADVPASTAEVTLTALKQADRLPQGRYLDPEVAERGSTFVCLEFRVENVGDEEFDTAFLSRARWTGEDGETTQVDPETGGNCAALGVVKENLLSEPDPRPGEFVRGTTVLEVPDDQPGVLEFSDRSENPLFTVATTPKR
ncbi:hypothetical protein [Streptomyces sp. NPDC058486]|uniref:hypothetical protein n=1 Tax=unclassified Streptomyces TaxID=2593676 RepID=UPI003667C55E